MKYLIALFIISNCIAGGMIFEVNDKKGKTIKSEFVQAKERKIVKEEDLKEKQKQEAIKKQEEESKKVEEMVRNSILKGLQDANNFFIKK